MLTTQIESKDMEIQALREQMTQSERLAQAVFSPHLGRGENGANLLLLNPEFMTQRERISNRCYSEVR